MIAVANRYQAVSISGAFTPTEILNTVEAGADIVKLFPAEFVGPNYVKTVLAPLSQVPIALGALFAGWLVALGWRKERPELPPVWFDVRQLLLVAWTVVALVLLGVSIHQGLLGTPEMQLRGNGSTYDSLQWFQDRSGNTLPTFCAHTSVTIACMSSGSAV